MTRFSRALAPLTLCLLSSPALAEFKVNSPQVEQGMFEIESKNRFDFDDRAANDDFRQHKLELKYGVNNWLALAVEGEVEHEQGVGTRYTATEFESYFQLTEQGQYWLDVGGKLAYEFKHHGAADEVEAVLFLEKSTGSFTHTLNAGIAAEVGSGHSTDNEWGLSWRTQYDWMRQLAPGLEYYAEFDDVTGTGNFDDQGHYFGPVVRGDLGGGFAYEAGWLFGISDSASDHSLKLNIEYEFPL